MYEQWAASPHLIIMLFSLILQNGLYIPPSTETQVFNSKRATFDDFQQGNYLHACFIQLASDPKISLAIRVTTLWLNNQSVFM